MTRRNMVPESVSMETPQAKKAEAKRRGEIDELKRIEDTPVMSARAPGLTPARPATLPEALVSRLPTGASRDAARMALHGLARTGNTILKAIDIPNRVFGNTRSLLQDIYEKSEENLARDAYEDQSGAPQVGETAVHLASAGVLGKALPAVFGANVGADTYETAKYAGASEGEALAKGVGHGVVDTAIWTLGQGLSSKYLPKAWQWLGRVITGSGRGAASSVTSDAMLNSLGADISGEDMAKRAAHAAWMVPLLGMLKMGGRRREEAMSLLRKTRPDLAGEKADKVIETIEAEFSDSKSQKVALAWVARKGANLPDDIAQIRQALEVSSKVKGLDPMSRSPFEILSDPAYARYLPKPKPQDVKAFTNMKRYPMGVIGFDVSDDAAGRQATREMINAYMSPSSNPWCLATGKGAKKLGGLGPDAEGYWEHHSAVPKQIFFQEVDGKLELTAFRATGPGGEGRQEYWDTSDAGYSGIPLKVKVPGDPMGRYQKMVFKPRRGGTNEAGDAEGAFEDVAPGKLFKGDPFRDGASQTWVKKDPAGPATVGVGASSLRFRSLKEAQEELSTAKAEIAELLRDPESHKADFSGRPGDTFDDNVRDLQEYIASVEQAVAQYSPVLVEDKVRTTENGITKFRTSKYADPTDWDYKPPKPGEQPKPVEIEESELVDPGWMRARGYDPDSEADVRRLQQEVDIQAWGNGAEAAMAVVPTKRTYMQTESGVPETVTYGPTGRDVASIDFERDGVPYRREHFQSGPDDADPSDIYHTFTYDDFPNPSGSYISNYTTMPSGYRLVRDPYGASPEVLNEVQWDEGLGSFVRTSGNRRWRLGPRTGPEILDPETRRRVQIVEDGLAERVARMNEGGASTSEIESMGPIVVDGREVLSGAHAAEAMSWLPQYSSAMYERDDYYQLYSGLRNNGLLWGQEDGWPRSDELHDLVNSRRVVIEDRRPDGTWAPAVDRGVDANGEPVELPPAPPEQPVMDAKGGEARADAEGGDVEPTPEETEESMDAEETAGTEPIPPQPSGPRIVINPTTFRNRKDALCVAFNERFRIAMEQYGFDPKSEPTPAQRRFFADTAYADDEVQLRRTILARILTLDTSIS